MPCSWRSRALAQKDVGRAFTGDVLRAFIAQSPHIDVMEEMLSRTEQHRPDREMHLVNQRRAQILPNRGHAPSEADVTALGGGGRLLQRSVNAIGDKTKLGASCHPERRPRVMREHEDRRVIRRLFAPPTLP